MPSKEWPSQPRIFALRHGQWIEFRAFFKATPSVLVSKLTKKFKGPLGGNSKLKLEQVTFIGGRSLGHVRVADCPFSLGLENLAAWEYKELDKSLAEKFSKDSWVKSQGIS